MPLIAEEMVTVTFTPGLHGALDSGTHDVVIQVLPGMTLDASNIPGVVPNIGWVQIGWQVNGISTNPIGHVVTASTTFTAVYQAIGSNIGGGNVSNNRISHDPGPYRGHLPSNIIYPTAETTVEPPSDEQQVEIDEVVVYGTEAVAIITERVEILDAPVEVAGYVADYEPVSQLTVVYTAGDVEARVNPQTEDSTTIVGLVASAIGLLVSAVVILFARRRFNA